MPGPVLEWRQAAREDLLAIVDYIADDNPAAAQTLKDEIETKVGSCRTTRNSTGPAGSRARVRWSCAAPMW